MNFKIGMLLVFFYFFFFSKKKNVSKIPAGCITFSSLFINASFLRRIHYLCRIILFFSRIHGLGTYIPISMGPLLFFSLDVDGQLYLLLGSTYWVSILVGGWRTIPINHTVIIYIQCTTYS